LPVEYLLVDLPVAFAIETTFTFNENIVTTKFPIENRTLIGESQVD
jgi:hypothetical protein